MSDPQQYCLRWSSHQSNLVAAFDELYHNDAFTDVTIALEGGSTIRCHKVVMAACSSYFANLFVDFPCKHPVVIIRDVKFWEIKAIIEYMYKGEVNVEHDQLHSLLQVANALNVKGLAESAPDTSQGSRISRSPKDKDHIMDRSPTATNSNVAVQNTVHSSSSNTSPPHSSYKSHYDSFGHKHQDGRLNLPMWAVAGMHLPPHPSTIPNPNPQTTSRLGSCYEASSDMSPLRRKKLSSLLMNRDTPILRTVLGQNQADSSQPVSLVCHPENGDHSNGNDDRLVKHMKNEPSEDAQSPYTDFTLMNHEEDPSKSAIPSSSPQSFSHEMRGVTSGIATYVPSQKPEWKRYKQYTRNDIMSAIEAVRNGMSALQAARNYKVPSRTLYDKVKKLGITTSRPFKRGSNGSSNCFPYGTASSYGSHLSKTDDGIINNNSQMMEASTFLQHALDSRGGDERETLAAMAAAAAAHAVASGHSTSPNNHGRARSPSPSPTMLKYLRRVSMTPSPAPGSDHHHSHSETNGSSERDQEDDEDHVEDLSINRKEPREPTRVIMPPMNQMSAIMKKEELLIDSIKEEARRRNLECEGE